MAYELERTSEPSPCLLGVDIVDKAFAWFLSFFFVQRRLGIEEIDLTWAAILEEVDDALGSRREMGVLRQQVVWHAASDGIGVCLLGVQSGEGERAGAGPETGEEIPAS